MMFIPGNPIPGSLPSPEPAIPELTSGVVDKLSALLLPAHQHYSDITAAKQEVVGPTATITDVGELISQYRSTFISSLSTNEDHHQQQQDHNTPDNLSKEISSTTITLGSNQELWKAYSIMIDPETPPQMFDYLQFFFNNHVVNFFDNLEGIGDTWIIVAWVLNGISIVLSGLVIIIVLGFYWGTNSLKRPSFRISVSLAFCDLVFSVLQSITLSSKIMCPMDGLGVRFISWIMQAMTVGFVFLSMCIALQLHLSVLMKRGALWSQVINKWYEPMSFLLAFIVTHPIMYVFPDQRWVINLQNFRSADVGRLDLVRIYWACVWAWIAVGVGYCAVISVLVCLRLWPVLSHMKTSDLSDPDGGPYYYGTSSSASTAVSGKGHGGGGGGSSGGNWTDRISMSWTARNKASGVESTPAATSVPRNGGSPAANRTIISTQKEDTVITISADDNDPTSPTSLVSPGATPTPIKLTHSSVTGNHGMTAYTSPKNRRQMRFAIQRIMLYPLVPIITQSLSVAFVMANNNSHGLLVAAVLLQAVQGIINFGIFIFNPALDRFWKTTASCIVPGFIQRRLLSFPDASNSSSPHHSGNNGGKNNGHDGSGGGGGGFNRRGLGLSNITTGYPGGYNGDDDDSSEDGSGASHPHNGIDEAHGRNPRSFEFKPMLEPGVATHVSPDEFDISSDESSIAGSVVMVNSRPRRSHQYRRHYHCHGKCCSPGNSKNGSGHPPSGSASGVSSHGHSPGGGSGSPSGSSNGSIGTGRTSNVGVGSTHIETRSSQYTNAGSNSSTSSSCAIGSHSSSRPSHQQRYREADYHHHHHHHHTHFSNMSTSGASGSHYSSSFSSSSFANRPSDIQLNQHSCDATNSPSFSDSSQQNIMFHPFSDPSAGAVIVNQMNHKQLMLQMEKQQHSVHNSSQESCTIMACSEGRLSPVIPHIIP
ncbi:hypothetical protein H4219_005812 [Mycoemilia scoparia]|uniref:Uncharacterized protein n=1 Tax=Mycoemilia scoparia TaxID=417184 RepID=A0A9W8DJ39_9FUNG|nr:hypothetical protein H4219_005812 [Mycoemilia scoparia]